ncbi:MAG: hypothetical protein ACR2P5_04695 [Gammaproteobacteria bacterium]
MPQFELDHGSEHESFMGLDTFTQGYIEAMFWTEAHADNPELDGAAFDELAPSALALIKGDCLDFQESYGDLLDRAEDEFNYLDGGVDFWLTRNRHGAGFWSRDLESIGRELTDAAHIYGESYIYRGDDGLIYIE